MKNAVFLIVIFSTGLLMSCQDNEAKPANPELFSFDSLASQSYEIYYTVNPSTKKPPMLKEME